MPVDNSNVFSDTTIIFLTFFIMNTFQSLLGMKVASTLGFGLGVGILILANATHTNITINKLPIFMMTVGSVLWSSHCLRKETA